MPAGNSWLSLKVSDKIALGDKILKPGLFIAVPKRIVPLAVRRNRLKRLIRESVRTDSYFKVKSKVYYFRVREWPGTLKLNDVKKVIGSLI